MDVFLIGKTFTKNFYRKSEIANFVYEMKELLFQFYWNLETTTLLEYV